MTEFPAFVALKDFVFNASKSTVELKPRKLRTTDNSYSAGTVFVLHRYSGFSPTDEFIFSTGQYRAVLFFKKELEELLRLQAIQVLDDREARLALILQVGRVE